MSKKVNNQIPPQEPTKKKEIQSLEDPDKFKKIQSDIDRRHQGNKQSEKPMLGQQKEAMPLNKRKSTFSSPPVKKQQVKNSPSSPLASSSPSPEYQNSQEQLVFPQGNAPLQKEEQRRGNQTQHKEFKKQKDHDHKKHHAPHKARLSEPPAGEAPPPKALTNPLPSCPQKSKKKRTQEPVAAAAPPSCSGASLPDSRSCSLLCFARALPRTA